MSRPDETGYALFGTAVGRCGIGWTALGIAALQLPEPTDEQTRARLHRRLPDAVERTPSPVAGEAIDRITALLAEGTEDLSDIPLDLTGVSPFDQQVYRAARTVPPGCTATYGAIAKLTGSPGAAREVGRALGRNPFAIIVPCHRVLAAGGRLGGFSANGGVQTKIAMLVAEGALLG
ncbi:MAG TPA: methylated-DNA--[protein]-cysteine S-methyltransferase [Pseudonocardiaceae bacterium]|jgi:methylated-DNA-[protein]-cysteine S-methyltransferase|nr:methylated-DNA--[protein]-cysteine S-methyltransferase [Pseudonocardiaceae bacterium]